MILKLETTVSFMLDFCHRREINGVIEVAGKKWLERTICLGDIFLGGKLEFP